MRQKMAELAINSVKNIKTPKEEKLIHQIARN
jgi:hypothetical protein